MCSWATLSSNLSKVLNHVQQRKPELCGEESADNPQRSQVESKGLQLKIILISIILESEKIHVSNRMNLSDFDNKSIIKNNNLSFSSK